MENSSRRSSAELPRTYPVHRLQDLGLVPRSSNHNGGGFGGYLAIQELRLADFPACLSSVKDLWRLFSATTNRSTLGALPLLWVNDDQVLLTHGNYHLEQKYFQPIVLGDGSGGGDIPERYLEVDFFGNNDNNDDDDDDDGSHNEWLFSASPPPACSYSPTQWPFFENKWRILRKLAIYALTAEAAVMVLEQLAQLPDRQNYVWKIKLLQSTTLFTTTTTPVVIQRALDCLPVTVRRYFTITGTQSNDLLFPWEAGLYCTEFISTPRGSRLHLGFETCTLNQEAQAALIQAIQSRGETNTNNNKDEDHRLSLRLHETYLESQYLIQLLDSGKVDTLELHCNLHQQLDQDDDDACVQALIRSKLRRLVLHPTVHSGSVEKHYIPFLNRLQFRDDHHHLKELVLYHVVLLQDDDDDEDKEDSRNNNCLVTILRSIPGLISFNLIYPSLSRSHWLKLLDAIRVHPSLRYLNLSCGCDRYDQYRTDRTHEMSGLLSANPRIETIYHGGYPTALRAIYDESLFRRCVEPKLELNWYRNRIQELLPLLHNCDNNNINDHASSNNNKNDKNTMTMTTRRRDALLGRALAIPKPSIRYLLLSQCCNIFVVYIPSKHPTQ